MTLQTSIDSIDPAYPVAGVDNDTQGFRDNFNNIKTALLLAEEALATLQSRAVLKSNLDTNAAVNNDLGGTSSITNGIFNTFYALAYAPVAGLSGGTHDIDLTVGSFQSFTMSADVNFTFRNWPTTGKYACVRVLLSTDQPGTPRTATFYSIGQGGTSVFKPGNTGVAPNGWTVVGGHPTISTPAIWTRTAATASPEGATSISFNDVQNIQVGTTVQYTPNGGALTTTTVTAVNSSTGAVTLADAVVVHSGSPGPGIAQGDTVTFLYNGPRLVEAWSIDGGNTVYLTQVADY
jgi:hypothetical protein